MGTDLKYGKVTTEHGNIPDDEPVFVLRAQDVVAIPTLQDYHDAAAKLGCHERFLTDVREAKVRFHRWNAVRKLPD